MNLSEIKEALQKIKYVFTEEFRKECEHIEFEKSMRDKIKLRSDTTESIDKKIERLRNSNFKSQCRINCSIEERYNGPYVGAFSEGHVPVSNSELELVRKKVNSKKSKF